MSTAWSRQRTTEAKQHSSHTWLKIATSPPAQIYSLNIVLIFDAVMLNAENDDEKNSLKKLYSNWINQCNAMKIDLSAQVADPGFLCVVLQI